MRSCMMFYYIFFTKGIQSLQKQRVTCMFFFFPNKHLFITQKGCYLCTVCTLGNIIDFIMNKQLGFPSCLEAMRKVVCVQSIIRDIVLSKVSFDN